MTSEMDLRTLFLIAFKFRWRATAVFLFFVILAGAASFLMPAQYSSTASVLVKIGRELIYRPDVGAVGAPLPTVDKDELIDSNIRIMRSASVLADAINHVGIYRIYPDLAPGEQVNPLMAFMKGILAAVSRDLPPPKPIDVAVSRLDRKLSIEVAKRTGIIEVSFMNRDPVVAAEVANDVVAQFQKRIGAIYDNPDLTFEEGRVNTMRAELDESQNKLNDYRHKHDAYALDNQVGLLLQQKVTVDSKLKDTESQIVQLKGLVAALNDQISVTPKTVSLFTDSTRHRAVDDATAQLLQLQVQEKQLATRFGNEYPQLAEVRNAIHAAQAALASQSGQPGSQTRTGLNDVRTALEQSALQNRAQLTSLEGMRDTLHNQIVSIDTNIATLSSAQPDLAQLEQDVAMRTDALRTTYDKLVEMRTIEGLNHQKPASFSVYEPATPADLANPARPVPLLYMVIGVVAGMLGSLVTLFLSYRMFKGFLTPKQLALRLNRPVLAVVDYDRRMIRWTRSAGPEHPVASDGPRAMSLG